MINIEKFRNICFEKRTHCIVCNQKLKSPLIKLPEFPLTEIYVDEKITEKLGFVDQEFHFCNNCGHGQLANIIDKNILYGDNYVTRTSTSSSAIEAVNVFVEFINKITSKRPIKNIIDIGCNDLYLLRKLRNLSEKLYGIDPILAGKESQFNDDKITVFGNFIENINFQELGINPDIVLSSHTLEHIEDPKKMIAGLLDVASPETLFFFQFPGLDLLVKNARFDQIFHQHLNYFSLSSVMYMLESLGAELIDFEFNYYHWGVLMICFKKKDKRELSKTVVKLTEEEILKQYGLFKKSVLLANRRLSSLKDESVYGYGAALMLPALNYYIIGLSSIKGIVDDDKDKEGLYYLNTPLQIVNPKSLSEIKNSIFIITAINSKQTARAIIRKLIDLNVKEIIIPVNLF